MQVDFIQRMQQVIDLFHDGKDINLARAIGLSANSIHKLKRGVTAPKFTTLKKIAEVSAISLDWLINGEGDIAKPNKQYIEKQTSSLLAHSKEIKSEKKDSKKKGKQVFDFASGLTHTYFIPTELFQNFYMTGEVKKIRTFRVRDNAMEPSIPHKSLVFIDTEAKKLHTGLLYLFNIDDYQIIRRASHIEASKYALITEKEYYQKQIIDLSVDNVEIIGQILYVCHEV